MRHPYGVQLLTDPETGFTCHAIAGGAGDDSGTDSGAGNDDGNGSRDGTDDDASGANSTSSDDGKGGTDDAGTRDGTDDDGRKGGPKALASDNRRLREERRALRAELDELKRQGESDADRIRREAREEALEPARRMARRSAVSDTARTVGFVDPSDAYAALMADGKLDSVEVDDERLEVTDLDAVTEELQKLAKRKPHLLTADARAKLEGRTASDTNGSSVDGQGSGSGDPTPNDQFGAILAGGRKRR